MKTAFRPIHCGVETLRLAGDPVRTAQGFGQSGFANEQMIARGTGATSRSTRPAAVFADFHQY